jgi:DNA-binding MarR family transcriptional regulator
MSTERENAFAVIHTIRHLDMYLRPRCVPQALRRNEMMTLGCLCHAYEQGKPEMTPSEIGKTLGVSRPAMTAILNSLEEKGLILRTMDHLDKRRVLVSLSNKGKAGLEKVQQNTLERVLPIVRALGETDAAQLLSLLQRAMHVAHEISKQEGELPLCEESQNI